MKKYLKLISRGLCLFLISMVFSKGGYTKVKAEESDGDVDVKSVQLTSNSITIKSGSKHLVVATILPENAYNKEVIWE